MLRTTGGIRFNMKVVNLPQVMRSLSRYQDKVESRSTTAAKTAGKILVAEAKRLILHGYYRKAYLSGKMYRSIRSKVVTATKKFIEISIGTNVKSKTGAPYPVYVHQGTNRMHARPFLLDAVNNKRQEILEMYKKVFKSK